MLADELEHGPRLEILEVLPAHLLVRGTAFVRTLRKDEALDGLLQRDRLPALPRLLIVQALQKEQVGDLFNDFNGICDTAGPKAIPNAVDLIA
jgi:hypothetical protein